MFLPSSVTKSLGDSLDLLPWRRRLFCATMKRRITKAETLNLATIGANTLRWFNESGGQATAAAIDYNVQSMEHDVARFDNGKVSQPVTWAGVVMLVRMGWCATEKTACPETFRARWVDALGMECEPWQSDALEIECEAKQ